MIFHFPGSFCVLMAGATSLGQEKKELGLRRFVANNKQLNAGDSLHIKRSPLEKGDGQRPGDGSASKRRNLRSRGCKKDLKIE